MTPNDGADIRREAGMLQCLECGAMLPSDSLSCPECGNDRHIIAERWAPTNEKNFSLHTLIPRFGSETVTLLVLTIALFASLMILGGARNRTNALLAGDIAGTNKLEVSKIADNNQVEIIGEPIGDEKTPVTKTLDELRQDAILAERNGLWKNAAEIWSVICQDDSATIDDFIAQGKAWEKAGDSVTALSAYNRTSVKFPENPSGYIEYGRLQEELGNLNSAKFQYEMGLSFLPDNPTLLAGLKRTSEKLGVDAVDFSKPVPDTFPVTTEAEKKKPEPVSQPAIQKPAPVKTNPTPSQNDSTNNQKPVTNDKPDSSDSGGKVTLIGSNNGSGEKTESSSGNGSNNADGSTADLSSVVELRDVSFEATTQRVDIILRLSGPVEFSTRSASEPLRLTLRLRKTKLSQELQNLRTINVKVPLLDRIALVESNPSGDELVLVMYLGADTGYTVAAETNLLRVILKTNPSKESQ